MQTHQLPQKSALAERLGDHSQRFAAFVADVQIGFDQFHPHQSDASNFKGIPGIY